MSDKQGVACLFNQTVWCGFCFVFCFLFFPCDNLNYIKESKFADICNSIYCAKMNIETNVRHTRGLKKGYRLLKTTFFFPSSLLVEQNLLSEKYECHSISDV